MAEGTELLFQNSNLFEKKANKKKKKERKKKQTNKDCVDGIRLSDTFISFINSKPN